jgi:EmrB/QacA subfamily drug resistance transporter
MTARQAWVLALTSASTFMIALDGTVVATALSAIRHDLGASIEALEWAMNAYILSFAVLLLTGAALGDRLGRRRMFVAGISLFTLASAACAAAPGIGWLIAARAVQGAGAALVMPLALTQLSMAFPPRERGRALGIFSGLTGVATFSGPFVGGAVAQGLAWQWIFLVNLPIGAVAVALSRLRLEESHGSRRPLDVGGVLLATAGSFGLVWGLVRGNRSGWGSLEITGSLLAGAVLVVAFAGWEARTAAPMVPMRFFRVRAFSAVNLANFSMIGSLYGTLFFLAQYLQTSLGYGPFAAGVRIMPWTGTLMVCAPLAGALSDRIGERWLMVVGLLLQTVGMGWLALIAAPDLAYVRMLAPLVIGGCGISMAMPAVQRAAIGTVAPAEIGQASGIFNMLRQLGAVFGIAIAVAAFARSGGVDSPRGFADGFSAAMVASAVLALVGMVAAVAAPGRRRPATTTAPIPDRETASALS